MSNLPFGSSARAVFARLVVRSSTVNMTVVLRHMEIDRPRTKLVGHLLVRSIELVLSVAGLQQRILRSVVAHQIEISVGKVRLKSRAILACRPLRGHRGISFQLCIPAQQISPSAANR